MASILLNWGKGSSKFNSSDEGFKEDVKSGLAGRIRKHTGVIVESADVRLTSSVACNSRQVSSSCLISIVHVFGIFSSCNGLFVFVKLCLNLLGEFAPIYLFLSPRSLWIDEPVIF